MPDIGWMELLVVGVVALIVMGPRDFPLLFRKLGQATGKVRAMAREFQRAMDEAADESGMTEINRDLRKAASFTSNPAKAGRDAVKEAFSDLDPSKYKDGSETKAMAEARAAKRADMREKAEVARAARAQRLDDIAEEADDMAAEAAGDAGAVEEVLRPANGGGAQERRAPTAPAPTHDPAPEGETAPAAAPGADRP